MGKLTEEQLCWIKNNLDVGIFKNQQHFTDVFNALFGTNLSRSNMANILCRHKWSLKTKYNVSNWTDEMLYWLTTNYSKYNCDFVRLAEDFNAEFNSNKSASCITKYLERQGIHKRRPKSGNINKGAFTSSTPRDELPIGTIRYNNDGRPFIKVKLCNGENVQRQGGHNFKEPWWKPLQKKLWEDVYGEVPNGYVVVSLNGNSCDTDINNIGIIDKRGTAVMAKKGWWTENNIITGAGVQWCNLYYTLKDSEY